MRDNLREQIKSGKFAIGTRLPSEAELTREHLVSRTVVREAIAALRADGLVEPRQGSGVYVLEPQAEIPAPFTNIDSTRLSSVIELLELRTAVEVEAAGLASQRCSPSQEEKIILCLRAVNEANSDRRPSTEADFALHLAIAEATNNPRFPEFIQMIGPNSIPRRALDQSAPQEVPQSYIDRINAEHDQIVNAILGRDDNAARDAMRMHLKGSQERYRNLLRK
ncbi:FadR/GntR family transcriptional regulator [Marivivens niveibacter]|uniref:FadR/GntR family transcriptional regulator n=1 Tax=Marivivens niveibacter TaxID=1930667 RepID=UPI001F0A5A04|nr:FadR/GntR family transcriptional regulator [Marivivens niveibacter]